MTGSIFRSEEYVQGGLKVELPAISQRFGARIAFHNVGLDVTVAGRRWGYEVLSGTPSNIQRHAKRMPSSFFRFVTF